MTRSTLLRLVAGVLMLSGTATPAHAQANVRPREAVFAGRFTVKDSAGNYYADTCYEIDTASDSPLTCEFQFKFTNRASIPTCTSIENGVLLTGEARYYSNSLGVGITTSISGGGVNGDGHMRGALVDPGAAPDEPTLLHIDMNIAETCDEGQSTRPMTFSGVVNYL
jgi:hypothetical protein